MKRHVLTHGICLLLAGSLLLASCHRKENTEEPTDEIRLTVETVTVSYTKELFEQASVKATEILARWLYLREGARMNDAQKAELSDRIQNGYLPIVEQEGVGEEELWNTLSLAERMCDEWERLSSVSQSNLSRSRMLLLCSYYRDLVAVLGSTRAGRVTYGGICFYLEEQIVYHQTRYEQYGLMWYDTAAKQTSRRLETLQNEVGAEVFSLAMNIPAFAALVASGAISAADAGADGLLYDGDLAAILRRQGNYFSSLPVSEYQWYVIGDIWFELGINDSGSLSEQMLATLHKEGIAARSALCMPELLSLYSAFADKLDSASLAAIRSAENQETRIRAVCGILTQCETEMLTVLRKFETLCTSDTEQERTLIENANLTDELAVFEQQTPVMSAEDFVNALNACADGSLSITELERAYLGTLRKTLPYLAFVIDIENHS